MIRRTTEAAAFILASGSSLASSTTVMVVVSPAKATGRTERPAGMEEVSTKGPQPSVGPLLTATAAHPGLVPSFISITTVTRSPGPNRTGPNGHRGVWLLGPALLDALLEAMNLIALPLRNTLPSPRTTAVFDFSELYFVRLSPSSVAAMPTAHVEEPISNVAARSPRFADHPRCVVEMAPS